MLASTAGTPFARNLHPATPKPPFVARDFESLMDRQPLTLSSSDRALPAAAAGAADRQRPLVTAWLALATVAIGLSTVFAVVLVIARVPQVANVLPAGELFHVALVLHVNLAVLIWFLAVACGLWSAVGTPRGRALGWAGFGLAAAGVAAVALSPLAAPGSPMATNYVPVLDSSLFRIGLVWFLAGIALAAARVLWPAWRSRGAPGDPLVFGLKLAALVTVTAFVSLLWSVAALPSDLDAGLYHELVSWGPGHIAQFGFTLLMLMAWLHMAQALGLPAQRPNATLLRVLFALAAAPALGGLALHALYAPDGIAFRKGFTLLMSYGTWPVPLLLGAWLAAWLTRLPPTADGIGLRASLGLSLLLFAAGCVLGAFIRTDSTMVPAHYHGTVGGITVALMAVTLRTMLRLNGAAPSPLARWQPRIYGTGLLLMVAGLAWLGGQGTPRKTPHTEWSIDTASHLAASALTGLGGLLAIAGGALFFVLAVRALRPGVAAGGAHAATVASLLVPESAEEPRAAAPAGAGSSRPRSDARPRALVFTVSTVLLLGLAFAYLPSQAPSRAWVDSLLAGFKPVDQVSHAAQMRRQEVDQRFLQGVAMLHARQYEHAVTAFHRVLELAPQMPEAHVNMGFALIGLERHAAARDFFESALALRDDQLNAYYGLAEALEGLGDLPGAVGAMRTYIHLAAQDDPYRRKAEAALWEWEDQLQRRRAAAPDALAGPPQVQSADPHRDPARRRP